LGEISDFLPSGALLPLIPPAPFSHTGRRGSLGVLMPETGDVTQELPKKPTPVRVPVTGARFPVPTPRFLVTGAQFPAHSPRFLVTGAQFPVPSLRHAVPGAQSPVRSPRFLVLSS
jgi:hypothetical protein